jgi:Cdc6-like AAA superfamily ATPase
MKLTDLIPNKNADEPTSVATRSVSALANVLTPVGIQFRRNDFHLGENLCRIYAIITYPEKPRVGWLAPLTNIPGTIVSIGFSPVDTGRFISSINNQQKESAVNVMTAKNAFARIQAEMAIKNSEQTLEKIYGNDTGGDFTTLIMVTARDESDFQNTCRRVEQTVNMHKFRFRVLPGLQAEALKHISATYPKLDKINQIAGRPFFISTFADGLPFASAGYSDRTGIYLGRDSFDGVVLYDFWEKSAMRSNSNITITGMPGQGKSTIMKHIIISMFARGTKVIIIDPEGEYIGIAENPDINGSVIDISGGLGGIINPFQVRPRPLDDEKDPSGELSSVADFNIHRQFLDTFFKLYLEDIDGEMQSALQIAITSVYSEKGITENTNFHSLGNDDYPTFSDLWNWLEAHKADNKDTNADYYKRLALRLFSAANGAEKGLWNGASTVDDSSEFIVLDTRAVASMNGNIKSAQFYNVLSWCWERVSRDRTEPFLLVADECWSLMSKNSEQTMTFLMNAEKRARKYEASLMVATQNISDFTAPDVAQYGMPVLDLPSTKILLGCDGTTFLKTKEVFNLSEKQADVIVNQLKK